MDQIVEALINSKSIFIETDEKKYFTWTSGKKSPIYCDNRQLISYPTYRNLITQKFCKLIREQYPSTELIAGTATAGISWAAWIANELDLPMIYIRSKPKEHGTRSAIEGSFQSCQKTLIIEDLISTGKSSINAYNQAKEEGLNPTAVLSIFSYGLKVANDNFSKANLEYRSLTNFQSLAKELLYEKKITERQLQTLMDWIEAF